MASLFVTIWAVANTIGSMAGATTLLPRLPVPSVSRAPCDAAGGNEQTALSITIWAVASTIRIIAGATTLLPRLPVPSVPRTPGDAAGGNEYTAVVVGSPLTHRA